MECDKTYKGFATYFWKKYPKLNNKAKIVTLQQSVPLLEF